MKAIPLLLVAANTIHAQTTTPTPPYTANSLEMGIPCTADADCTTVVRSQSPPNPTGVPICGCYAQSTIYSLLFDECEGSTDCITARCQGDACTRYDAYCNVNEDGRGLCSLREPVPTITELEPETIDSSSNEYMWVGKCSTDQDCYPKMRESTPGGSGVIGVSTCECYANSKVDPLDECQGNMACAIALCTEYACTDKSAFCSDEGTCQLDDEVLTASIEGEVEVVDLNPCIPGQCLSSDGVCEGEVACFVDPCDINNGGCGEGDCEANYCGGCNAVCIDSVTSTTATDDNNANVRPSDPTPVTQAPVDYNWDGPRCSTDDDCFTKIRERVPGESEVIGVTTCQCYANSFINPLDECQGEADMTCPIAGCIDNPCRDYKAFCLVESGLCYLEDATLVPPAVTMPSITSGGSVDLNTPAAISSSGNTITAPTDTIGSDYTWSPICSTDDDCHPSMRTDEPGETEPFGVAICQCYANSFSVPFDECQGDVVCISAMCLEFACEGRTAYCSEKGICELSAAETGAVTQNTSNTIATVVAASSGSTVMISAPDIVIDETSSNEIAQGLIDSTTEPAPGSTAENTIAIDETATSAENEPADFVADGTSSSVIPSTPSDPDLIAIDETSTSSTIQDVALEVEVSNSTSQNIEEVTVSNETSEEVQLETSTTSTTTFEESIANVTIDDENSTATSTTTSPEDAPVAVSENNISGNQPNEVDKSQEGLPRNSGVVMRSGMTQLALLLPLAFWLMS